MSRTTAKVVLAALGLLATPVLLAQSNASTPSTSDRPDAVYPKPAGQDSSPQRSRASKPAAPAPGHAAPERPANYHGNSGKKKATSTACSSARLTGNGQLDCGTHGDAATGGKLVTK